MSKILCICLSSTIQRSITFENLALTKVNRSKKYRVDASGKAVNSARVLSQLEKNCAKVVCPLGTENKQLFIDLLKNDNVDLSYVEIPGFTRECWTLMDTKNGTTTELVVSEPAANLKVENLTQEEAAKAEAELLEKIKIETENSDAVLLAGSKPSIWSKDLYTKIACIAKEQNKIFLADYWAEDLLNTIKTTIPSIIKINDEEFCKTFGLSENAGTEVLKTAICEKSKELNNIVIVTRGTEPTFAAQQGTFFECPIQKIKPVNTTACGDSFNSGFLYEYLKSKNIADALQAGTVAAAKNAQSECPGALF